MVTEHSAGVPSREQREVKRPGMVSRVETDSKLVADGLFGPLRPCVLSEAQIRDTTYPCHRLLGPGSSVICYKEIGMTKTISLPASIALAVLLACIVAAVEARPSVGQMEPVTLVGAGDISSCSQNRDSATAKLLLRIPGTVFTLGDNAQGKGAWSEFKNCYRPTWGKYRVRTMPAVGNHEYRVAGARPYFTYFGARAGTPGKGYYSYDRRSWHVVVLNSNCDQVGGCGRRSPQGRWLRHDLANHTSRCTLAYFHHPLYASGTGSDTPEVRGFWRILYRHNADVILAGHAHRYERFRPITPSGEPDAGNGIRQFIVGTGGEPGGKQYGPDDPNMEVKNRNTPGVLKLTLRAGSYSWKFIPIAGKTFTDSGADQCH